MFCTFERDYWGFQASMGEGRVQDLDIGLPSASPKAAINLCLPLKIFSSSIWVLVTKKRSSVEPFF